jgi:hypothetical protein
MKGKIKRIIFLIFRIIASSILVFLLIFSVIFKNVQSKMSAAAPVKNATDTAIIHFIHGSIAQENCIYPRPRLGGLLGGHVEIELDGKVYGFRHSKRPVHIFPQDNNRNSTYDIYTKQAWLKRTEYEKMTAIKLPISVEQKRHLQAILTDYLAKTPYDYAFFGKRCASSTADLLVQSGIICPLSTIEIMVAFLSPHPLRYAFLRLAEEKKYGIERQKGVDCRFWE